MLVSHLLTLSLGILSGVLGTIVLTRARKIRNQTRGIRLACPCTSINMPIPSWPPKLHDFAMMRILTKKRGWDEKKLKPMKAHLPACGIWTHSAGEAVGDPEWAIQLDFIYLTILSEIEYRERCYPLPAWREHETWMAAETLNLDTASAYDMLTLRTALKKVINSGHIFYANIHYKKTGFPEIRDVHLTIEGEEYLKSYPGWEDELEDYLESRLPALDEIDHVREQ